MRLLASIVLLAVGCAQPPTPRPDLLLVTLDTTRMDAIGAYGADPSPTPVLDGLARSGMRVHEAMSVAPLTLPAHTSVMSGVYPDVHRVRDNGQRLPDELPLLAEQLKAEGYSTGAVVAAVVLDGSTGIDRGFDVFHDAFDISRVEGVQDPAATRDAGQVVDAALKVLDQLDADKPRFVWVHFYDAHLPLSPPAAHAGRFSDPYLAEVAYADAELGRLLRAFPDPKAPHGVVVVADHGEGRGDHGEASHGQFVYRSTMAVPFVIAGTGVAPGTRPGPASLVDVAPTLLDLARVEHKPVDGRSVLADEPPGTRMVYGESYHQRYALGLSELHVFQDARARYIEAPRPELYAWTVDRDERTEITDPDALQTWVRRAQTWRSARPPALAVHSSGDARTSRALQALGYLPGGDPSPEAVLPDPKDHPDLQARVDALIVLARTRPPAEAVPLLRDFIEEYPRIRAARTLLVRALQLSGEAEAALAELEPLLAETPDDVGVHAQAAELALALGRMELAVSHVDRAAELEPDQPTVAALAGEIERRQGRCAGVLPRLDRVLARSPEATRVRVVRAACRRETGDVRGATSDLERVLAEDPDNTDVRYLLALCRLADGESQAAIELLQAQLRLTPDAPLLHQALGLAWFSRGEPARALPHLRVAARSPDADVGSHLALAEALLAVDGPDAQIEASLDAAAASAPNDPRHHRIRAAHLLKLGRSNEALDAMVRSRELSDRAMRERVP